MYVNGKLATGNKVVSNKLYIKGVLATDYKLNGETLFYNGVKFTGDRGDVYYEKGNVYTGFRTLENGKTYYSKGKKLTGLYNKELYVDGLLNKNLYVYSDKLYNGATVETKAVKFQGKLYYQGVLANGKVLFEGNIVEYVNGVLKDSTTPPIGTDPKTLTNQQLIEWINNYYQTKITPSNMEYISQIIEAYSNLSSADQAALKEKVQLLQTELNKFQAELNLTSEEINKKTVYTEITSSNIDEVKKILAAYNKLSDQEKANVTYPISTIKTMVDIFTIKNSGITKVDALNAKEVAALINLYKGLSPADQESLKVIVANLETKLDLYLKTDANYTAALEALTKALSLTLAEQSQLSFSVDELKSKVEAYKFNQKPTYLTINNAGELSQAMTIINEYASLPTTTVAYVTYDIEELKKVIKVYDFSVSVKLLNVDNEDDAKTFIKEYTGLPQDIKTRIEIQYKEKLETAKLTIEVEVLQKLMNNAMALNITKESSVSHVNTAKEAISAYQNASTKVSDRVIANIDGLKESVAGYDFVKYYNEVVNPATKSLNLSVYIKPANNEIAKKELAYIGRMYNEMAPSLREDYNTQLDVRYDWHITVLDPSLSVKKINGVYTVINLDNTKYANITYNFEKEFKYTESVDLVKKLEL